MLHDLFSRGEPITPGTGIAFVGYRGQEVWGVSWESRPDGVGGTGTQDEIRQFLLKVRPQRVVIWDNQQDDYVDLDPTSADWPRRWTYFDDGPPPTPRASWGSCPLPEPPTAPR